MMLILTAPSIIKHNVENKQFTPEQNYNLTYSLYREKKLDYFEANHILYRIKEYPQGFFQNQAKTSMLNT